MLLHAAHVAGTCVGKVEYSLRPIRQIPSVQGSTDPGELPGPVTYDPAILPDALLKDLHETMQSKVQCQPDRYSCHSRQPKSMHHTSNTVRGAYAVYNKALLCWGAPDESGCLPGRVYALNTRHPTNPYMSYNESRFLRGDYRGYSGGY